MKDQLVVSGEFEIPVKTNGSSSVKRVDKNELKSFWKHEELKKIKSKQGCYIFALRVGRGYTPWYVGKSTKNFGQECFTDHKLGKYNDVLFQKKGTPTMFFIHREGTRNVVPNPVINEMEKFLIQSAAYKNEEITNIANTKMEEWAIKGVLRGNKGKPSNTEQDFKKMMGL